ncbi:Hypothetical protein I595_3589 [Croceitalea dokdonensis DOKDO 023]|uniref:Uncharacterized protein n=1 Tax=Croceitalea dokdonensis DOKDO 023 TaxID=1300341 RepID=A0A0P7AVA5_9FLAO|nr:DUF6747 family protein [Croceitalea dokdonensis]KPM30293.1 Hypothetical protein I595_3589 [Croceitalea dokdonensis DOKDO 023]
MGTFLHVKNLYINAFDERWPKFVVALLKGYTLFCAFMFAIALYAFVYRMFTGFHF